MGEPRLELLDLGFLIKQINEVIEEREGEIYLGNFIELDPKRNPFLHPFGSIKPLIRGKYPLIHTYTTFCCDDKDKKVGYVFIESGITDGASLYSGAYESMRFRLKTSLSLDQSVYEIPDCSVKITVEIEEWQEPSIARRDHVPLSNFGLFRLGSCRTNLEDTLPTHWFLAEHLRRFVGGQQKQHYALEPTGTEPKP